MHPKRKVRWTAFQTQRIETKASDSPKARSVVLKSAAAGAGTKLEFIGCGETCGASTRGIWPEVQRPPNARHDGRERQFCSESARIFLWPMATRLKKH